MRQRNFRHSNRETYYEIWMRKSCLQPPEILVFVFSWKIMYSLLERDMFVCVCVCARARACRVLLCLFDLLI